MSSPDEICPKCRKPLNTHSGGLVTQYIEICRCSLLIDEADSIRICLNCKKRISSGRDGTITQFIFGQSRCSCDKPVVAREPTRISKKRVVFTGFRESTEQEQELQLSAEIFPLERYKPIKELGRGASGCVYLAKDRLLGKSVAVKTLINFDQEKYIAFQDEARATSKLNHEGIVQILDFGVSENSLPFMVMEYIPGISLNQFMYEEGTFDENTALMLIRKAVSALSSAHKINILHRDIKPSNIILFEDENETLDLKVIDFGIAKVKESSGIEIQEQTLAGSPGYMAPDTLLNYEYGFRSEIYSIGCVLFEMLAGLPPFVGETALQTLSLHAHEPVPSIEGINSKTQALIDKCLAKKPSSRFDSLDHLKLALNDLIENLEEINLNETSIKEEIIEENNLEENRFKSTYLNESEAGKNRNEESEPEMVHVQRTDLIHNTLLAFSIIATAAVVTALISGRTTRTLPEFQTKSKTAPLNSAGDNLIPELVNAKTAVSVGVVQCRMVNDQKLKETVQNNPLAKFWSISNSKISSEALSELNKVPVSTLALSKLKDPIDLSPVASMKKLEYLRIVRCSLKEGTLQNLTALPKLKTIFFLSAEGASFKDIAKISTLKEILVSGTPVNTNDIELLAQMPRLTILGIGNFKAPNLSLLPLKSCSRLHTLMLDSDSLSEKTRKTTIPLTNIGNIVIKSYKEEVESQEQDYKRLEEQLDPIGKERF